MHMVRETRVPNWLNRWSRAIGTNDGGPVGTRASAGIVAEALRECLGGHWEGMGGEHVEGYSSQRNVGCGYGKKGVSMNTTARMSCDK